MVLPLPEARPEHRHCAEPKPSMPTLEAEVVSEVEFNFQWRLRGIRHPALQIIPRINNPKSLCHNPVEALCGFLVLLLYNVDGVILNSGTLAFEE